MAVLRGGKWVNSVSQSTACQVLQISQNVLSIVNRNGFLAKFLNQPYYTHNHGHIIWSPFLLQNYFWKYCTIYLSWVFQEWPCSQEPYMSFPMWRRRVWTFRIWGGKTDHIPPKEECSHFFLPTAKARISPLFSILYFENHCNIIKVLCSHYSVWPTVHLSFFSTCYF